jgi:hypothetical protein
MFWLIRGRHHTQCGCPSSSEIECPNCSFCDGLAMWRWLFIFRSWNWGDEGPHTIAKLYGADGLVFGALTEDGHIDKDLCMSLVAICILCQSLSTKPLTWFMIQWQH